MVIINRGDKNKQNKKKENIQCLCLQSLTDDCSDCESAQAQSRVQHKVLRTLKLSSQSQ